jgi:putative tricarboxylic transport membrane protein
MSAFMRKGDFWSGCILALLGAYIVKEAQSWEYSSVDGPGPGFFPLWYGGAMIVLSLLLVVGTVLKSDPAVPQRRVNWAELRRVLTCWAAFVACIALLNVLGFIVSFALMTWFIIAVLFRKSQRLAIGLAVVGALSFYALFSLALGVALPAGILF